MLEKQVTDILSEILKGYENLFLVDVELRGKPGNQKLVILIDGDPSITIDQCAEISRSLGSEIESEDLIDGKYYLEVSSPGLDMPLKLSRQYKKNIGRRVKVELENGERMKGSLESADEQYIVLLDEKTQNPVELNMKEIKKTNILVSFN